MFLKQWILLDSLYKVFIVTWLKAGKNTAPQTKPGTQEAVNKLCWINLMVIKYL